MEPEGSLPYSQVPVTSLLFLREKFSNPVYVNSLNIHYTFRS